MIDILQPHFDPEAVGVDALSACFFLERVFMLIDISIDI